MLGWTFGISVLIYGLAIMSFWLTIISFFICLGGFLAGLFFDPSDDEPWHVKIDR